MKQHNYSKGVHLLIAYLLIVNAAILTKQIFYKNNTIQSQLSYTNKAVLGTTYPPSIPDFSAGSGGVKTIEPVTALVSQGTYGQDFYLWVNPRTRQTATFVSGYFQISDMYDVWLRKQSDSTKITNPDRKYILSIAYSEDLLLTDQNITLPESSIKLAYSSSYNGPWSLLSTALNSEQNTAGTITDKGGFYMLVAGFGELPPSPTPTPTATPTATPFLLSPTQTATVTQAAITQAPTATPGPTLPNLKLTTPSPTTTPQRINFNKTTPRRKDFIDRIIDALLVLFGR